MTSTALSLGCHSSWYVGVVCLVESILAELGAVIGVHLAIRLIEIATLLVIIIHTMHTRSQGLGQMALRDGKSIQSLVL